MALEQYRLALVQEVLQKANAQVVRPGERTVLILSTPAPTPDAAGEKKP